MGNININIRYEFNPFVKDMVINEGTKRVTISPLGKDNDVLVNQLTGEVKATHVVTLKKYERTQFVKVFAKNIALTFDLPSYGTKALNVLIWVVQHLGKNKDSVLLDLYTLRDFLKCNQLEMSPTTFRPGLTELVKAKIIAKALRKGWYFINPNFIFNGDRIVFSTVLESYDNTKTAETVEATKEKQLELDIKPNS